MVYLLRVIERKMESHMKLLKLGVMESSQHGSWSLAIDAGSSWVEADVMVLGTMMIFCR